MLVFRKLDINKSIDLRIINIQNKPKIENIYCLGDWDESDVMNNLFRHWGGPVWHSIIYSTLYSSK